LSTAPQRYADEDFERESSRTRRSNVVKDDFSNKPPEPQNTSFMDDIRLIFAFKGFIIRIVFSVVVIIVTAVLLYLFVSGILWAIAFAREANYYGIFEASVDFDSSPNLWNVLITIPCIAMIVFFVFKSLKQRARNLIAQKKERLRR
jgi:type IV secretory pathway VirB3-like protein